MFDTVVSTGRDMALWYWRKGFFYSTLNVTFIVSLLVLKK